MLLNQKISRKGIPVIKIKNIISPIVDTKDSQKSLLKHMKKLKVFIKEK